MDHSELDKIKPVLLNYLLESERSRGILAGSLLDSLLEQLIKNYLVKDSPNELFKGYGPLSSFSAKIDMAFSLGLITKIERDELHRIRRIRNEFAHSLNHNLCFSESPIREHIKELKLTRTNITKIDSKPETDFKASLAVLIGFLQVKLKKTEHLPSPPEIDALFNK